MHDLFGTFDGRDVHRITLRNGGMTARVLTLGAILNDLRMDGIDHSLVLGSPTLEAYLGPMGWYGATVGRVANRIAGGRATLDGRALTLERNEMDRTTLHGGTGGAARRVWEIVDHSARACRLRVDLPDGQAGFPGNLTLTAAFRLDDDGALEIAYGAITDAPTFCNIAHHGYWNLSGHPDLSDHRLSIAAAHYLPVDNHLIPLGPPAPVAGTRFDFREPRPVIRPGDELLDHNFCLDGGAAALHPACTLWAGGLRLDVATTEPGLQVYDGTAIDSAGYATHSGQPYGANAGIAIEPQAWPDAPNQSDYPDITLRPGDRYTQVSRFHVTRDA